MHSAQKSMAKGSKRGRRRSAVSRAIAKLPIRQLYLSSGGQQAFNHSLVVFRAFLRELKDSLDDGFSPSWRSPVLHCFLWREIMGVSAERHDSKARNLFSKVMRGQNVEPYGDDVLQVCKYSSSIDAAFFR